MTMLTELFLGFNKLHAERCKIKGNIPQGIGNLSNLRILRLEDNQLTGSIPIEIGKLRKLQVFYPDANRLQGYIPSEICNLRKLGELYLSDNNFNGSIPACMGDITSLRVLYLSSNNLTSTIPSSLWNLRDIVELNLSNNSLVGHLPLDIGNLRAVTHIDLASNELSGEIPSSIGNLQTLSNFSIAHNKLEGRIPESFGNVINLEILNLSSNNLSGAIPKSLEKLRYLKYFNVSFNRLDGEIPTGGAFANFSAESFIGNGQLCGAPRLQVPPCKTGTIRKSKTTKLVILICILLAIASAMVVLPLTILWFRSKKRKGNSLDREDASILATWRRIPYEELYRATNGFDESNLLGTGGFGSVYKGKLLDGMDIAAKVFNLQVERALKSFDDECEVMSKIRHRNLVKIISCCSNLDFKALVLEYIPNGSLEQWLYSHNYCVDILRRLNIMIDVASALEYLHHGYGTPIVHCDLKPSNVLLDEDMVAHVCDFGIAKLLREEDSLTQTHTLATIGYMAPGNLSALKSFLVDNRRIKGRIPYEVRSLSNLTTIHLRNNDLTGPIPTAVGKMRMLQVLYLDGNRLQGSIQNEVCHLRNLGELYLGGNKLSRPIPACLGDIISLLEGEIPTKGPFTNFSAESFMGNSELCGALRLQVPPCKTSTLQESKKKKASVLKPV
ncbi:hypothetical protein Q3G72_020750 [Acer saccharum]|nr:hypothetical protein Q3G72_020750 [Acer saccharum]